MKKIDEMLKANPNQWPHQFVVTTETKEGPLGLATKMMCIHCLYFYWDVYPRPRTACKARTDAQELKRLLG